MTDAGEKPSGNSPKVVIAYETPTAPQRPAAWVLILCGGYVFGMPTALASGLWLGSALDTSQAAILATVATLLAACSVALLLTPIAVGRRRPMTRRSILIPIVGSGLLMGGLVLGGRFALAELFAPTMASPYWIGSANPRPTANDPPSGYITEHKVNIDTIGIVVLGAVAVWVGWSLFFILITRQGDPTSVGMRLHQLLIAGSVLELLVAVPSHVVVRRRSDCCAGIFTGTGICLGVVIALISFGPGVLFLYQRRFRRIRTKQSMKTGRVPGNENE